MANTIVYELPLNERIRTILRLDFLARRFEYFVNKPSAWDSRAAVDALLDASVLVDRADLRNELIKELDRQLMILAPLEQSVGVNVTRLREILDEFDLTLDRLKTSTGPLAQNLRTDEFLFDVQNRIGLPGGTCDFDLPYYHAWLERSPESRRHDLLRWAAELKSVWDATKLILNIIRGAGTINTKVAEKGSFQINFSAEQSCQLVRVILPAEVSYHPEMSGDRHRVTIRFLIPPAEGRPVSVCEDISFNLACCIL